MSPPGDSARYPLGVYDHPADPDVPFLHSTSVGDSFPAVLARKATSVTNDLTDFLDDLNPLP